MKQIDIEKLAIGYGLQEQFPISERKTQEHYNTLQEFAEAYHALKCAESEPASYLLRRKDWPEGEYKPFLENHAWASESVPLYTPPTK